MGRAIIHTNKGFNMMIRETAWGTVVLIPDTEIEESWLDSHDKLPKRRCKIQYSFSYDDGYDIATDAQIHGFEMRPIPSR